MVYLRVIILQVLLILGVTGQLPMWKSLLRHHSSWTGVYHHNSQDYGCSLIVHSVGLDETSTTLVSFSSGNATIEMNGYAIDNNTVEFKEETVWDKPHPFVGHPNLRFTGAFITDSEYYLFAGNVSSDRAQDFGTIHLRPEGSPRPLKGNGHLSYGLAIGIPVTLAIMLMISAVLILWWGVRKGYLRHVPRAYKFFTNPKRSRSDHEMSDQPTPTQTEEPEVYI